jgi:hypothetical protein
MSVHFNQRLLALFIAALALSGVTAKAGLLSSGVNLGRAQKSQFGYYAVFSLGGGIKDDDLTGKSDTYGDLGAAGNGDVDLTGDAVLHGDLYYHSPGQLKLKNRAQVTGMTYQNATTDSYLNGGVTDATNASNIAAGMASTPTYSNTTKIDKSMTITGLGPATTVVLNLTDFNLAKNDTLTLNGPAGSSFIFNISHNFAMHDNSQIILGPGIDPLDVLFNVRGTGSDAVIDGKAHFRGVLMANLRNARVDGDSISYGEIIANHIDIKKNAIVKAPRVVSD